MNNIKYLKYRTAMFLWHILKPKTFGARALLIKGDNILLVKHTYQPLWFLPGGGLKYGETYDEALRRELREELNANIYKLELFGIYNSTFEGKNDSIAIFLCEKFDIGISNCDEITEMKFFKLNDLPGDISPGSYKRIKEYIGNKYPNFGKW